jgi:outer membrane protein assembly factor BamB
MASKAYPTNLPNELAVAILPTMTCRSLFLGIASFSILLILICESDAGEWPQILGPSRDGVARGETIQREWGEATPTELWNHPVGQGYAGVAVVEPRAILFHRMEDDEVVEALDTTTGKVVWSTRWPVQYRARIDPDTGPRCIPLIHDNAVYLHGVAGRLVCLDLKTGTERWARDTRRDYQFPESYFGVGSSPLLVDDKLIVNVGGPQDGGIVAFSVDTGKTLWQSTETRASYASPIATVVDDQPLVLVTGWMEFVGLDPESGDVKFSMPYGKRGPTVTAANPVLVDPHHVFLSASYRIGARLIEITSPGAVCEAQTVWDTDDLMSSQYSTSVGSRGIFYGVDGREDGATPRLRCFDPKSREVYWNAENFGMATLIRAGDTLLAMKTDGELVLIDASIDSYHELARFRLFHTTTRALPALADGRFYVHNSHTLKVFDLGTPETDR